MEKPKYYNKHIEEQNKKFPLINVRCKECKSENWNECWTSSPLKIFCLDCKQITLGEGNKLY